MNAQQVVVGIYLALEQGGATNLVERTRAAARAAGVKFDNGQAARWLSEFTVRHNGKRKPQDQKGRFLGTQTDARTGEQTERRRTNAHETDGTADGSPNGSADSRASHKVSLFNYLAETNVSACVAPQPHEAGVNDGKNRREKERSRALRLPLERAELDRRREILRAVWEQVQPYIGRATTFTVWQRRNNRVAASFVKVGMSPAYVVAAWGVASKQRGEPIRELAMLQREIEKYQASRAAERQQAVAL